MESWTCEDRMPAVLSHSGLALRNDSLGSIHRNPAEPRIVHCLFRPDKFLPIRGPHQTLDAGAYGHQAFRRPAFERDYGKVSGTNFISRAGNALSVRGNSNKFMTPPLVRFGLVVYRGDFACIRRDKDDFVGNSSHGPLWSRRYILHLASSRCSTPLPMPAFAQSHRMAR